MGALHAGHLSLVRKARQQNEKIAVSIFLNPIQFNNVTDLDSYPKDLAADLAILKKEKVDLVWTPSPESIYPPDYQTYIRVSNISKPMEGLSRPGHFEGVTTVVAILFNALQPHHVYFGEKDAQQLAVIRQMVKDLKFNLEIVPCPTIREKDGLAVSSRNQNLSDRGRLQAVCLFNALSKAMELIGDGESDSATLINEMTSVIALYPLARIDYISIADPLNLAELDEINNKALLSLAVYVENVRLIDNMTVDLTKSTAVR
jgi:pantoate--beta-alanine ligase